MPIACSTSALTGQEGSIWFQPAGTQFCLEDHADFKAGTSITVPHSNDYRVGDEVKFTEEGTANLDSALTSGTPYHIVSVGEGVISVSATAGGTPITLTGDGGSGSANTPGAANHIQIDVMEYNTVCQVREFSIEITREELDVTTLPCGPTGSGGKYASFRKTQAGYASGTGSMTVYFTDDQTTLANRLLGNVLLKSQQGAAVKLYVNTAVGATNVVDDTHSLYIEADISITSMSLSVNPDDPTSAELSFSITNPKKIFGATIG